jgi:hypothetical protein
MREYPAYGRTIASHIVRGVKPMAIAVLLSERWDYFNHLPKVCIKPEDWSIARYEFGFLRGLHVVLIAGDGVGSRELGELVIVLMRVGPRRLWVWNADGEKAVDDDSAHAAALFARERLGAAGALTDQRIAEIRAAELVMVAAQTRAGELWHREYQRLTEKRPAEEVARWMLAEYERLDRVRELLSSPWRKSIDVAAA